MAVPVPVPPGTGSHYPEIGAFQGLAYHRNAFARGTAQEVEVLVDVLDLRPGARVLDVGCGNGRHVAALRDRGVAATGVDLAPAVLAGGPGGLVCALAQGLPFADGTFDAVISVCQGGFGVEQAADRRAVAEWHRVLKEGGRLAMTAFSLVFAVRWMAEGEAIDVDRGVHHHLADVRGRDGETRRFDLWTTAYSVPHLRDLLTQAGLRVLGTAGVEAGGYQRDRRPTIADPEVLIWAERR